MIESSSFNTVGPAKPKFTVRLFYRKSLLGPHGTQRNDKQRNDKHQFQGCEYLLEERDRASLYILFFKLDGQFIWVSVV